jgi:Magnesium chelatase, subunit ChlI C-terminal/Magnesium chelatase, subunit ChlI
MAESDDIRIERIFHPYATEQMESFAKKQGDGQVSFVHYTSAEAALRIFETKRIWMRNVTSMSDYSEVQHGMALLNEALFGNDNQGFKALTEAVDGCAIGATTEAIQFLQKSSTDIRFNTYLACISEHDKEEDQHGRLSMWRANRRVVFQRRSYPQPCGYFGDPTRECHCTPPMIQRYVSKISGPLLDRIDIHIEVPAVKYKELRAPSSSEDSASVRGRVIAAKNKQIERFKGEKKIYCNAQMAPKLIRKHCAISAEGEKLLENAVTRLGLSARARDRILKVARTIADLDASLDIIPKHLSEAIQYRTLDRSYWS